MKIYTVDYTLNDVSKSQSIQSETITMAKHKLWEYNPRAVITGVYPEFKNLAEKKSV
jgi:hypothetical protein